jgi:hypothetical protein
MVWICALDLSGSGQNAEAWTRWLIFGFYKRAQNIFRRNVADLNPINKVVLPTISIIIKWMNKTMGYRCFTIRQRFFLSTNILSFLLLWRSSDSRTIPYRFQVDKRMRGVVLCQLLGTLLWHDQQNPELPNSNAVGQICSVKESLPNTLYN